MNRIISKEKEREDPRRDSSKTSFQLESKSVSSVSTRSPVTTTTSLILHTELILLQEIQGSSYAGLLQQLFPMYPSILHGRIKSPSILQCSRPLQHKQASSNSRRQKQHSTRQPAYTQSFQQLPGAYHKEST